MKHRPGQYLPDCMVQYPSRQPSLYTSPSEPEISRNMQMMSFQCMNRLISFTYLSLPLSSYLNLTVSRLFNFTVYRVKEIRRFSKCCFFFRFTTKFFDTFFVSPCICVLRQSHEAPRYSVFSSLLSLPAPNILLSTLFSDRLCLCSSIIAKDQVILPYKTGQVIVLYILI